MQDTERLAESALSERYSVRYDYWKETLQQDIAALQPLLGDGRPRDGFPSSGGRRCMSPPTRAAYTRR